ncbi:MAG: serine/threonine protein kinase [Oscillospiraceae bacterium]|jgi:serine/threonine-protein kinase|nr:serine/threonine protein kinase [Oscillospiraceae bacterium]
MTLNEIKAKYTDITHLKRGGQKTVYKATDSDNLCVALKIINNANDKRVLQEIDLLRQLKFPNIPRIIDSGVVLDENINENVLYIVEEYIDGVSLRDWINAGNRFDLETAYSIIDSLLNIEVLLEENNILHRDINPNNIILTDPKRMYLIDFGLAKKLGNLSLTMTAAANGPFTPGYAPHEQFANMKLQQDSRTDLFQIGVTVYESCTGKNPFVDNGDSFYNILSKTATLMPPLLSLEGDTKGMLSQFVSMLMAKNQSQRPDTAKDALRYLLAIKDTLEWSD